MTLSAKILLFGSVMLLRLLMNAAQAQRVQGGAGFLYLGASQWPGASAVIHQLNQGVDPASSNQYTLIGHISYYPST